MLPNDLNRYGSRKFVLVIIYFVFSIINGRYDIVTQTELDYLFFMIAGWVGVEGAIDMLKVVSKPQK